MKHDHLKGLLSLVLCALLDGAVFYVLALVLSVLFGWSPIVAPVVGGVGIVGGFLSMTIGGAHV